MKRMNNPANETMWVNKNNACPVCGRNSNVFLYREGLARENLENGNMFFVTNQMYFFAKCGNCGHVGPMCANANNALTAFYTDIVEPEEIEFAKEAHFV